MRDDDPREGGRDRARTSFRHRPAHVVPEHPEEEAEAGRDRRAEVEDGVAGQSGEQRGGFVGLETLSDARRGAHADRAVPRQDERVSGRHVERRHEPGDQRVTGVDERTEQTSVCVRVASEPGRGGGDAAFEEGRAATVERMREGASGWIHSSPCAPRESERIAGEATPRGWIAEHTSCTKPGRVNCSVRRPPPISDAASSTRTRHPARARVAAATRPFGPAPTTTASNSRSSLSLGVVATGPGRGRARSPVRAPGLSRRSRAHRRGTGADRRRSAPNRPGRSVRGTHLVVDDGTLRSARRFTRRWGIPAVATPTRGASRCRVGETPRRGGFPPCGC